jgi:uncharacterized protein with von Willebrand factor type A (vWA) domain
LAGRERGLSSTSTATPDLAAVSARLAAHLHAAGIEAGPDRAARFASALRLAVPVTDDELYWLGRVTLVGSVTELEVYDRVFADVFGGIADLVANRGDPNMPSLDVLERGRQRRERSDRARFETGGSPRPVMLGEGRSAVDDATDDGSDDAPTASPSSRHEILRRRDFGDCTIEELAELQRLVERLEVVAPRRASRRRRRHAAGSDVDLRATLRSARRTGGHPARLVLRRPSERPRRVVLIADVSGSMERYSRAYLYLLHGAVRALRAETFVFATRLTRLTRVLRSGDPERALRTAVGDVEDWSGGTRIGEAIREFNDRWGRRGIARGAVVVIVSDGWESDDPALLAEQMARLGRLAHHVVWVNPRSKHDRYEPLVGGMAAAMPHVDTFASGHSLDALDDVLTAISTA